MANQEAMAAFHAARMAEATKEYRIAFTKLILAALPLLGSRATMEIWRFLAKCKKNNSETAYESAYKYGLTFFVARGLNN